MILVLTITKSPFASLQKNIAENIQDDLTLGNNIPGLNEQSCNPLWDINTTYVFECTNLKNKESCETNSTGVISSCRDRKDRQLED